MGGYSPSRNGLEQKNGGEFGKKQIKNKETIGGDSEKSPRNMKRMG